MDFFTRQEQARRKSFFLILLYLAAVAAITAFFNLVALAVARLFGFGHLSDTGVFIVSAVVLGAIAWGTLRRYLQLREGGVALAELLGAREIEFATDNADERKLRNVTEEMAIASGTPMPALYLLERERGINAFVAGYRPGDTVLVVTRGALENLGRDELQGVIAHEFSHIFYGDMRINLYLMALLSGITVIGESGSNLMERSGRQALSQVGTVPKDRIHGFHLYPILVGGALAILGYIGVFCARLIKAAISRQRELLADAAAVQFTRERSGLATALYKIQTYPRGTWLGSRYAEEVSHLCFVPSLYHLFTFGRLLATHPPTEQRIRAIDKYFFIKLRAAERDGKADPGIAPTHAVTMVPDIDPALAVLGLSAAAVSSIGNPGPAHLRYARKMQKDIDDEVLDAIHSPHAAAEVVYALLLSKNRATLEAGGVLLKQHLEDAALGRIEQYRALLKKDLVKVRLPLLDLALPALKKLTPVQRENFLKLTRGLIEADGKTGLFEYAVQVLLDKHLLRKAHGGRGRQLHQFAGVRAELGLLLALVARTSGGDTVEIRQLYAATFKRLDDGPLPSVEKTGLDALEHALQRLDRLSAMLKKKLIQACADCILADQKVEPAEFEVLRIVCEALDCPMPPLIGTHKK